MWDGCSICLLSTGMVVVVATGSDWHPLRWLPFDPELRDQRHPEYCRSVQSFSIYLFSISYGVLAKTAKVPWSALAVAVLVLLGAIRMVARGTVDGLDPQPGHHLCRFLRPDFETDELQSCLI